MVKVKPSGVCFVLAMLIGGFLGYTLSWIGVILAIPVGVVSALIGHHLDLRD